MQRHMKTAARKGKHGRSIDVGGAQMAHPARPEESSQNHHAMKDHSWNSKSSMWWPAAVTTLPARAWVRRMSEENTLQMNHLQNRLQLSSHDYQDWNNLSLTPDQNPHLPLTAQDLPWESGSSVIQVCPWQIDQQLEVVADNGHPSIWWPRSIVLNTGFPEQDIGVLSATESMSDGLSCS